MDARILPLPFDPAAIAGLSAKLLASHHQNNYGGAVKRLNALRAHLASTAFAAAPGFQLNGLKREELIATNSMLLHELYFASLGGDGKPMVPAMKLAFDANFGSLAYFSDRGRPFQSERGRCFSVIVDGLGKRTSPGLNVAQSSTISLKRPAVASASRPVLGLD